MNDMQIYAQVAKKPRIGASEIANNLGLTLATVSADLRMLVDAGDLVKSKHFEDSGRQWQVYELSDEFKASRRYAALISASEQPAIQPPPLPQPAAMPAPAPAPAAQAKQAAAKSKVQLAIDCLTKLGSATDDQLRDAMGLLPRTYVPPYLASAVKSGKVARDGDRWKLGTGKAEAAPKVVESAAPIKTAVVNEVFVSSRDAAKLDAAVDAIAPPAAPAPSKHRCAIWSDGTYELQTDGERVAVLTHEQAVAFVTFIERIGTA